MKSQACVLAFRLEGTEGGDGTPWGSGGCLALVGSCTWGQDPAPWGKCMERVLSRGTDQWVSVARTPQACLCWICSGLGGKTISFTPTHHLVHREQWLSCNAASSELFWAHIPAQEISHGVVTAQGATSALPAPPEEWHRLWLECQFRPGPAHCLVMVSGSSGICREDPFSLAAAQLSV